MKSSTTLAALVAHCRKLAHRQQTPDAELLRRFVEQRETAAFEELLQRHAPLVWGVCRRILPNEADGEDAFQAVFLALFRQAGSVDPQRPLGAWLHGVAVRAARKAQARSARQRTNTTVPEQATAGDVADELSRRELFRAVDEEIARLPDLPRGAFILCCLQGRTRDEAAETLGCSVAAVKSRLERARALLRRNLERRGVQLPAAFLVLGLTVAHVRVSLRVKAMQSVLSCASPAVAALVPAVGASLMSKLTLTAISVVMVGVLGFGAYRVMETEPPKETVEQKQDAAPKPPLAPASEKAKPLLDRLGDPLPPGAIHRFGTLRFRHHEIVDLAFTPDSKQLIAGSGRSPLTVFDAATGRKLRDVGKTSSNNHYGFALSPDGKRVACCGHDVSLWDLQSGRLIRELGCGRCQAVAFSPDGTKIAAVKEEFAEVVITEVATGKRLAEWTIKKRQPRQYNFRSLAYSPDSKFLAGIFIEYREEKGSHLSLVSSQVYLLDSVKGTRVRIFGSADDPIYNFAFQPGTGRLAGVGKDGLLRFWDVETGKEVQRLPAAKKGVHVPLFSADGRRCIVSLDQGKFLAVLDAKNGRELRRIEKGTGKNSSPSAIALSSDGRTVAYGELYGSSRVRVWDVESGAERLANAGHDGSATLSLSADGRTLISRGEDGKVFHWDVRTGVGQRKPNAVGEKADRPTPRMRDAAIRGPRWQYKINYETMELEVRGLKDSPLLRKAKIPTVTRGSALSADGTHLAIAFQDARHTVYLWNPEKEERPRMLTGHPDACQQLLFSHDGKRLIAGAGTHNRYSSETVWIWDVTTARIVRKLATNSAPGHLLLTADDRVLLTGGWWNDATVHAWDMETGKELAKLSDPSLKNTSEEKGGRLTLAITGLALSSDERFLAIVSSGGDTSAVSIWETGSWKLVRAFAPIRPRYAARSMVFSRDGRSLFVANSDSTILQWDVSGRLANGRRQSADKTLNKDRLNNLWRTLAQTPDKAYPAVWELLDHPAESVPFLIDKLSPIQPVKEKRVSQLLKQLDSESFAEREEANRQLLALGEPALSLLRQALKNKPSLEMKKRLEGVIESLKNDPPPQRLRLLRALAVLEWSGMAEADAHLRRLAEGDPSATLTRAAKAARQRRY